MAKKQRVNATHNKTGKTKTGYVKDNGDFRTGLLSQSIWPAGTYTVNKKF